MARLPIAAALLLLPLSAQAASPFDGTYRGSQEAIRANSAGACVNMNRDDVVIRVVDGRFSRKWGANTSGGGDTIELQVKPDGTFSGSVAALAQQSSRHGTREYTMSGRITGNVLEAELGSNLCAVRMRLERR